MENTVKPLINFINDEISKEMILLEDEKKAAPMTQNIGTVNGPVIQQGSGSITLNTKNGVSATDLNSLIEKLISSLPAITDTAAEEIESVKDDLESLQEQIYSSAPKKSRMQKALAGIKKFNIDSASRNVHRRLNVIGRIAMNKTAIKNFAIWARNKLIADIQYRAGLMGITADGIKDPLPQSTGTMEFYDIGTSEPYAISGDAIPQRKKLAEVIRRKEKDSNYATAYKYILEEVAYTWFNRLIAIRFMEVNDYLPSRIRVLSSESGKIEPDLVTTPFDAELTFTHAEEETVLRLKTENKLDGDNAL